MKINLQEWEWGWLQWGHEGKMITKEAEEKLKRIKEENPHVDFEKLAEEVRTGKLKPV